MSIFYSTFPLKSLESLDNKKSMLDLVDQLKKEQEKSLFQGKEKAIAKAGAQGKFTARERIELLLDENSFFLELLPLIGLEGDGFGPGGTTVSGIGMVEGRICVINANIGTLKGGAIDKATLQKTIRISEIALENKLTVINLVESSGANLPEQEQIFNMGGTIFREITRRSEAGLCTISLVFGNSTAGGAYVPGMSDYSIFVKNNAKVFLAGPPLVKMATAEEVDEESLGGAHMHSTISGVSDYLAEDEYEAFRICREILTFLPKENHPKIQEVQEPLYEAEEILSVVPASPQKPFDCRELIARIVDGSEFTEFKPAYGPTLICCFSRIHGHEIGILGNNGVIFSEAANKATHFIQLCNKQNIPLIFLQNTTGFMVGLQYEREGIIKHGAKLINVVSNAQVPSITIMTGASFGAGNYAMNGRAFHPRFLFSYPNAQLAVMGPEQLAGVMTLIQRQAAEQSGLAFDEENAMAVRAYLMAQVEKNASAWYASAQGWDDAIINPRDTRMILGLCLQIVSTHQTYSKPSYGVFRM
jgi:acetyl-CoA carboxylase carboxyltransferase component